MTTTCSANMQALKRKCLKAIAMTYRGHELEREDKASDAIAMFDAVAKLEPTESRRFAYAVLLYKNNKQDDAEDHFMAC